MTFTNEVERKSVAVMHADPIDDRGERWGIEDDLMRTIVSVIQIDSNPKKVPLKMITDPDKFMSVMIPKGAKKVVLVLSKEMMGLEGKYRVSVNKACSSAAVMVLFSHKLEKDMMLIFFK